MRVTKVQSPVRKQILKSAGMGAALTAGVSTASQAYYMIAKKDAMQELITKYGGRSQYFKNYAIGLAAMTAASAVLSGLVSYVANKIHPIEPQKSEN